MSKYTQWGSPYIHGSWCQIKIWSFFAPLPACTEISIASLASFLLPRAFLRVAFSRLHALPLVRMHRALCCVTRTNTQCYILHKNTTATVQADTGLLWLLGFANFQSHRHLVTLLCKPTTISSGPQRIRLVKLRTIPPDGAPGTFRSSNRIQVAQEPKGRWK